MSVVFGYLQPDQYYHMDDTCPTLKNPVAHGIAGTRSVGEYGSIADALSAGHINPCPVCCKQGLVPFSVMVNGRMFRRSITEREIRMIRAIGDAIKLNMNSTNGIADIYGVDYINILPWLSKISSTEYVEDGPRMATRRKDGKFTRKTFTYALTPLGEAIYYDVTARYEREAVKLESERFDNPGGEYKKIV